MFHKIKEEKEEKKIKFHIHISEGTGITNVMWNLPGNPRTLWLDYGDALIFEFYEGESVTVSIMLLSKCPVVILAELCKK